MIFLLASIIFFAAAVQTLSGFGFALIVMPLVTLMIGFQTAAPLVAMVAVIVTSINFARYRAAVNFGELIRLGIACALGIPIGVWSLAQVSEAMINLLLGVILIAYAVYSLVRPTLPVLRTRGWTYAAGFTAGCLGGAYNVPGPPVILYGRLRGWPKDEFRAVLQALFLLNSLLVTAAHFAAQHITAEIVSLFAFAVPGVLLGILTGSRIDIKLNDQRFRLFVNVLLLLLGISLIFSYRHN